MWGTFSEASDLELASALVGHLRESDPGGGAAHTLKPPNQDLALSAASLTGALGSAVEDGPLMEASKVVTPKSEVRHIARAELLAGAGLRAMRAGRARIRGEREGQRGDAWFARTIRVAAGAGRRVGELCDPGRRFLIALPVEERSVSAQLSKPIFRIARERMWSPTTPANRFVIVCRDWACRRQELHDLRRFFASTWIAGAWPR